MNEETATLDVLERQIVALAEEIDTRMERWLGLVARFDARGGGRAAGFRSTAEWLAWRCHLDARTAREHVRVARELAGLPAVRDAFAEGGLSYSKVRALTRGCTVDNQQELLELARSSTAWQVEAAVRSLRTAASADVDVANRSHERRRLEWWWDPDGSLRIVGRLGADDGAALIDALETAAEALHPATVEGEPDAPRPALGARHADALLEILHSGAPRAQVVLHADPAALACTATRPEERAGEVCALEDGPAIPSEMARRLSCDAEIVSDQGRRRRVVSPALRTSLERRDGGCRFPGCTRRHGVHAHHLTHWAHGGSTDADNLILLCRFHHRLVHEVGFAVGLQDGEISFRRPDGRVIPFVHTGAGGARAPALAAA